MSVLTKDPSDRTVCRRMMSPGMVSDTKSVRTHFTLTLQLSWHSMTMRGIWRLFNIYCKCRAWCKNMTGTTVASLSSLLAVRPAVTLLFDPITVTTVSLISMGASGVQLLQFSCVMHVCLISVWGSLLPRGALVHPRSAHYRILFTQTQRGLLASLIQLENKRTLWN